MYEETQKKWLNIESSKRHSKGKTA